MAPSPSPIPRAVRLCSPVLRRRRNKACRRHQQLPSILSRLKLRHARRRCRLPSSPILLKTPGSGTPRKTLRCNVLSRLRNSNRLRSKQPSSNNRLNAHWHNSKQRNVRPPLSNRRHNVLPRLNNKGLHNNNRPNNAHSSKPPLNGKPHNKEPCNRRLSALLQLNNKQPSVLSNKPRSGLSRLPNKELSSNSARRSSAPIAAIPASPRVIKTNDRLCSNGSVGR